MDPDRTDVVYGREYALAVSRRRRVVVVLLGLTAVALLAVVALSRLDVAHTSGPLPVASTGTVALTPAPQLTLQPVPATREGVREYTVRSGDTLDGIASRFGRAPAAIAARNRLRTPDHLSIGQRLEIPAAPVLRIAVVSASSAGVRVRLTLRGEDREQIVFAVQSPTGPYVGPPHAVDADGQVRATYDAAPTTGRYDVTATGDRGTRATAAFDLVTR